MYYRVYYISSKEGASFTIVARIVIPPPHSLDKRNFITHTSSFSPLCHSRVTLVNRHLFRGAPLLRPLLSAPAIRKRDRTGTEQEERERERDFDGSFPF